MKNYMRFTQAAASVSLAIGMLSGCAVPLKSPQADTGKAAAPAKIKPRIQVTDADIPAPSSAHNDRALQAGIKTFVSEARAAGARYTERYDSRDDRMKSYSKTADYHTGLFDQRLRNTLDKGLAPIFGKVENGQCLQSISTGATRDVINNALRLHGDTSGSGVFSKVWKDSIEYCDVKPDAKTQKLVQAGWDKTTDILTHYSHPKYR